jgi:hypothetical protein
VSNYLVLMYLYLFLKSTSDNIAAANKRALIAASHDNRRLIIEERNQLIKLHEIGVYSKEELLRKLDALDDLEPINPTNQGRAMSPSASQSEFNTSFDEL